MGTGNPLGPDLGAQLQSPVHLQGVTTRMPAVFTRCRATARNLAISTFSSLCRPQNASTAKRHPNTATSPVERRIRPGTGSHWRERLPGHCSRSAGLAPQPLHALSPLSCGDPPRGAASRHPAPYPCPPAGPVAFLPSFCGCKGTALSGGEVACQKSGPGETIKKSLSVGVERG